MLYEFLNPLASAERLFLVVGVSAAENVQDMYLERKQKENLQSTVRQSALIGENHEATWRCTVTKHFGLMG